MHSGGLRPGGDRGLQSGFKYHLTGRIGQADFQGFRGIIQSCRFSIQKERCQTQPVICLPCHPATGAVKSGQNGKSLTSQKLFTRQWAFLTHRNTICNSVYSEPATISVFTPLNRLSTGGWLHSEFIAQRPFEKHLSSAIACARLVTSSSLFMVLASPSDVFISGQLLYGHFCVRRSA